MVDAKWIKEVPEERRPCYYDTPYFKMSKAFEKQVFLTSLTYEAKEGDLFIATYPKNGTTWTQNIVHLIHHQGKPPETFDDLWKDSVFLEMKGKEAVETINPNPSKSTYQLNSRRGATRPSTSS